MSLTRHRFVVSRSPSLLRAWSRSYTTPFHSFSLDAFQHAEFNRVELFPPTPKYCIFVSLRFLVLHELERALGGIFRMRWLTVPTIWAALCHARYLGDDGSERIREFPVGPGHVVATPEVVVAVTRPELPGLGTDGGICDAVPGRLGRHEWEQHDLVGDVDPLHVRQDEDHADLIPAETSYLVQHLVYRQRHCCCTLGR